MKRSLKYREVINDVRRVVVKIGSRVLVQKTGRPDVRRMRCIVTELAKLQKHGYEIVLVTSGAIGAGMEAMGMRERPSNLPDLQMAAAVGQTRLMSKYDALFSKAGCKIGQILLTHADFHNTVRFTNAKRTIENLIRNNVIPIINENDAVANEEIKADVVLGDNDLLASLLVKMVRADILIMLTTVDGLREKGASGKTRRVKYLETVNRKVLANVKGKGSSLSTGGMASKLRAAGTVSKTGCAVVIANGRNNGILGDIMSGQDVGTFIIGTSGIY